MSGRACVCTIVKLDGDIPAQWRQQSICCDYHFVPGETRSTCGLIGPLMFSSSDNNHIALRRNLVALLRAFELVLCVDVVQISHVD